MGKIQQLMTSEVFNDTKRLLHRSQYFNMLEGEKISALLPRSLKKQFNNGIIIPVKMKRCKACKDGILCTTCNNQVNEKKLEIKKNLFKQEAPMEFGHLLPYFKEYLFCQLFVLIHLLYTLFFLF